jgi:chemotaxis protein histidine kinase CheA
MSIDMSQFFQVFFEETSEHLANMENLLLNLDVDNPVPGRPQRHLSGPPIPSRAAAAPSASPT